MTLAFYNILHNFLKEDFKHVGNRQIVSKTLRGKFSLQVSFRCLPRIIKPTVGGVRSFFLPDARWNPRTLQSHKQVVCRKGAWHLHCWKTARLSLGRFSRTVIASSTWNHSPRHIHRISPIVYYFSDSRDINTCPAPHLWHKISCSKPWPRCPL